MNEQNKDNKFWFGFFLGGLLGAIVLFFVGTKEGKKNGKEIRKKGEDLIEDIQDRLEELKEKGRQIADEGLQLKTEVEENLNENKEKITTQVKDKIDTALSHIEALQERGRETTASLRKSLFKNLPKKSS